MNALNFIKSNARWLAAGALLTFISAFGQTFFVAIFAGELQRSFNLSHADWGGIYFLGTMSSGLLMIWAGGLADRYRVRSMAIVMLFTLAAVCLAMSFNPTVWMLPIVIFGLRFCGQGMISHIAIVAMARWYVAARGKAIAIASLGFSLGEACLPLVFVALLTTTHWRNLWLVAAACSILVIPILLVLLKTERVPSTASESRNATGMNARHWTRPEVLADWRFWALVPVITIPGIFSTALFFQQVHLADSKGWTHVELVSLFPVYTIVTVVCGLLYGLVIDRWSSLHLMPVYTLPMALAYLIFYVADSLYLATLGFVFTGVAQGGAATVSAAIWPEIYGTRHLGSIKAFAAGLMVFGSAVGPGISGLLIDHGITFPDQMRAYAIYMIVVSGITVWVVARIQPDLENASASA